MELTIQSAVFLLLILAASTSGQSMKPCCFPQKYEGGVRVIVRTNMNGTNANSVIGSARFSVDYKNQLAFAEESENGKVRVAYFMDFMTNHVIYTVNYETNTCSRLSTSVQMKSNCIPSTARFSGMNTIGFGSSTISTYDFDIPMKDQYPIPDEYYLRLTVTKDTCLPVMEAATGVMVDDSFVLSSVFFGVTMGIANDSIFIPPPICNASLISTTPPAPWIRQTFMYVSRIILPGLFPQVCCGPSQFTATALDIKGYAYMSDGSNAGQMAISLPLLAVDFIGQRLAVTKVMFNRGVLLGSHSYIQNFATGKIYNVITTDPSNMTCTVYNANTQANKMKNQCISTSAEFMESSMLGYGANSVKVNTWRSQGQNPAVQVTYTTTVTDDSCSLVADGYVGSMGPMEFSGRISYSNMKVGVDPTVFVPPAICNNLSAQDQPMQPTMYTMFDYMVDPGIMM